MLPRSPSGPFVEGRSHLLGEWSGGREGAEHVAYGGGAQEQRDLGEQRQPEREGGGAL